MPSPSFFDFVRLGLEHIFTGYDHLFFLSGLLLVCRRGTQLIAIITAFTLGHSATLALATLQVINLSPRITEPLIALTILFVGLENYLRRGEQEKGRYPVTFLFGLIHGFGFANVLREFATGAGGVVLPLFGFNLGVELGQLIFAGIVLPLFWWLHTKPVFERRWIPGLSIGIALMGLYWFVERTLLVWFLHE